MELEEAMTDMDDTDLDLELELEEYYALGKDSKFTSKESEDDLIRAILNDLSLLDQLDFFKSEYLEDHLNRKLYDYALDMYKQGIMLSKSDLIKNYILHLKKNKANIKEAEENMCLLHIKSLMSNTKYVVNPIGLAKNIQNLGIKRDILSICYNCITATEKSSMTEDASILIQKAEDKFFNLSVHGSSERKILSLFELTEQSLASVAKRYADKDGALGVTSGFKGLDTITNGFQNSDLIILAGRPSMGKTALAVNMAYSASVELKKKGGSALFFSLEMSAEQLCNRILSMNTGVPGYKLRSGHISQKDYDNMVTWQMKDGKDIALYIDDSPNITIPQIKTKAKQFLSKNKLGIIFIDYLQLIQTVNLNRNFNRTNELSIITRDLKQLAKDLNVPIIVLSQLSRAVESREDKRPMLSDLRESGSIEQDADIVMFIYRDEYYARRNRPPEGTKAFEAWVKNVEQNKGTSEIIIAKHRNGAIADIPLIFNNDTTLFKDKH